MNTNREYCSYVSEYSLFAAIHVSEITTALHERSWGILFIEFNVWEKKVFNPKLNS